MNTRPMWAGATVAVSVLAGAGAMLAWAMPTGAILGPLARMLDAYAPWLLALGLILAAVAVVLGARRTGSLLTLALALAGAVQVSAYLSATRPAQPALPGDLRVLFFNAFAENASNGARIVAAALETEADILIFAEAEALLGDLDTLTERYAFVSPCDAEACELLIATNLPVLRSWQLQLNPAWPARYAVTEVDLAGHGPLFIAAGHLVKPWMSGLAEPELAQLTAQLNWLTGPSVVVGDFNMPPWSQPMRALLEESGFTALRGAPGTWPAAAPGPFRIPIDQVLVRDGVAVRAAAPFGVGLGSNHLGLLAEIALR